MLYFVSQSPRERPSVCVCPRSLLCLSAGCSLCSETA